MKTGSGNKTHTNNREGAAATRRRATATRETAATRSRQTAARGEHIDNKKRHRQY